MPSRVSWSIPSKLIYLEMLDFVTYDEIIAHMQQIEPLVRDNAQSTVHLIVDCTKVTYLPTDIRFLAKVSRPVAGLPNMGYVMVVGAKLPLISTLAMLVCQIVGFKLKTTPSFEEAMTYLQSVDPELQVAI